MSENDYSLKYLNLHNMYKTNLDLNDTLTYKTLRQHNYNNNFSINNTATTSLDTKSVNKLLSYNLGLPTGLNKNSLSYLDNLGFYRNDNLSNSKFYKNTINNFDNNPLNSFKSSLGYSFIDLKSPNKQILPSDRGIRSLDNFNSTNMEKNVQDSNYLPNKLSSLNTVFPTSTLPTTSLNRNNINLSYDSFNEDNSLSSILRSKEESAPNFVFNTY
jgi:hypothetical protein